MCYPYPQKELKAFISSGYPLISAIYNSSAYGVISDFIEAHRELSEEAINDGGEFRLELIVSDNPNVRLTLTNRDGEVIELFDQNKLHAGK